MCSVEWNAANLNEQSLLLICPKEIHKFIGQDICLVQFIMIKLKWFSFSKIEGLEVF